MSRIAYEKKTVAKMIELYCRRKEQHQTLCEACKELIAYAHRRLDGCKYGEQKSSCRRCTTHCYHPKMRYKIREVMRFSGPRMLFFHPIMALKHLWAERR
ncbi:MAG: nitrous oxide-stimulated promoter family protein [Alistipes sp.]|nr:nitrous oxide-stimulated promoter family protein [Alistipes sp.]